jgi:hypothetical protein
MDGEQRGDVVARRLADGDDSEGAGQAGSYASFSRLDDGG